MKLSLRTAHGRPTRPALAGLALLGLALPGEAQESWLVRAERIHTAAGDPIDGGVVVIADGKIRAVGPGSGRGDDVIECAAVTPGLIDLSPDINTGLFGVEQSTETPVELNALDGIDPWSTGFARALEGGVTSVLLTAPDLAVIAGLGGVVKTAGDDRAARVVAREAVLRGALGSLPSVGNIPPRGTPPRSFYYRRPNTRMGVEWTLRKAFYDARADVGSQGDPVTASRNAILRRCLAGELPLSVLAWTTQDIRTAVYLKEEFSIPRMFVASAAEAWKEPELLVRSGMGVVLPPWNFSGRTTDRAFHALDTAAKLHALGVPVALSGSLDDRSYGLARQPGFAMRGGLSADAALRAVTIVPARLAGVDGRLGSLEVGKDADLVLWSGPPFEPTSRILAVFVDGKLLVDNRQTN